MMARRSKVQTKRQRNGSIRLKIGGSTSDTDRGGTSEVRAIVHFDIRSGRFGLFRQANLRNETIAVLQLIAQLDRADCHVGRDLQWEINPLQIARAGSRDSHRATDGSLLQIEVAIGSHGVERTDPQRVVVTGGIFAVSAVSARRALRS